ncbi:MAG: glucose-6-phosphate dehydrogenase (NADP(+)), partial [Planctomycetota bacterium]
MAKEAEDAASQPTRAPLPKAGPFTLVIFGASGDLTQRKLLPAYFRLHCEGLLPAETSFVGFARSDMTDQSFREGLRNATKDTLSCHGEMVNAQAWESFAPRVFYHRGAYDSAEDFAALQERLEQLAASDKAPPNRVYYLATPPVAVAPIVDQLGRSGMARTGQNSPWARVVVEKPFGRDLASARQLNRRLGEVFDESQIFRIDHYLGKETVQNILVLRFANSIFEHLWSHDYIDYVQITVAEQLGIGGRGGYYDQAGAIRDMLQSHMMHLLCLVAM